MADEAAVEYPVATCSCDAVDETGLRRMGEEVTPPPEVGDAAELSGREVLVVVCRDARRC